MSMLLRDRLENELVNDDDLMSESLAVEIVSWVCGTDYYNYQKPFQR